MGRLCLLIGALLLINTIDNPAKQNIHWLYETHFYTCLYW